MKDFHVEVLALKKVYDLPDSWCDDDYRSLLNQLEIEDIDELSGSDLLDILIMGLQDMEPEEAADLVLAHKLPARVTPGTRRNIIDDFMEQRRPWEEASDIRLHARIFSAGVLLSKTFPPIYGKPDVMKLTLQLKPMKPEALKLLQAPLEPAFITRLLADGMDEHSILERLFDEQLAAHAFPEAEGIIWLTEYGNPPKSIGDQTLLTLYSSVHWLEHMESTTEFESSAYNDYEIDDD